MTVAVTTMMQPLWLQQLDNNNDDDDDDDSHARPCHMTSNWQLLLPLPRSGTTQPWP